MPARKARQEQAECSDFDGKTEAEEESIGKISLIDGEMEGGGECLAEEACTGGEHQTDDEKRKRCGQGFGRCCEFCEIHGIPFRDGLI
jgi:hypothetical protein